MMLFGLLALVADIVLIVFCALPGTPGANQYGSNPYDGMVDARDSKSTSLG
jgi:uncharacterized membrane protein YhaH (DUF805 family)